MTAVLNPNPTTNKRLSLGSLATNNEASCTAKRCAGPTDSSLVPPMTVDAVSCGSGKSAMAAELSPVDSFVYVKGCRGSLMEF
jgi:hypothetical protein